MSAFQSYGYKICIKKLIHPGCSEGIFPRHSARRTSSYRWCGFQLPLQVMLCFRAASRFAPISVVLIRGGKEVSVSCFLLLAAVLKALNSSLAMLVSPWNSSCLEESC